MRLLCARQKEKGKLAHLWAKAEVAEAEATGKQFLLPQDSEALDPNVFPYKVRVHWQGARVLIALYISALLL